MTTNSDALEPGVIPSEPLVQRRTPEALRSRRWFGPADLRSFGHRSRAMQMGYAPEEWTGKPVIAIVNTWSDLQPCHSHFKTRVDDVKRGILMAGGFPVELPALSVSESFVKPTTMNWPGAAPAGRRRNGASSAVTAGCSPSTSNRPTRAATSTSCAPSLVPQFPSR